MKHALVTYALPYANGPIHLGHLMGLTLTDIWVRHQRQQGKTCYFVSGDDAHGTPIMIKAEQEGLDPETYAEQIYQEHCASIAAFNINLDNYHTTHSPENEHFSSMIYQRLQQRGDIKARIIEQAYDPKAGMFLPDRYVKGDCPKCGETDQYGDNCEACGATYSPVDLKNARSSLTGATPELKTTEHYFFELQHYTEMLQAYITEEHLQPEVAHKLCEWFQTGLQAWDITRDAPYFGFTIPGHDDKYFYVWLDAPIGYMASFKQLCEQLDLDFDAYWNADSQHELYHFIGKDIIYFHALFWPAMLHGANLRTPTEIFTHGFITINGKKMSKSRGTFITGKQFSDRLPTEYFRYYLASKSNGHLEDVDFNFAEFMTRVNSDLVGKVVNIASRSAKFINKNFNNQLSHDIIAPELLQQLQSEKSSIMADYTDRNFAKAVRTIMTLADQVNQFIDHEKPWQLIKDPGNEARVQAVCTMGIECFRQLILYLKPIMPELEEAVVKFLQIEPLTWNDTENTIFGKTIAVFTPLLNRIQQTDIDALAASIGQA